MGFYRSNDPKDSVKALKEIVVHRQIVLKVVFAVS